MSPVQSQGSAEIYINLDALLEEHGISAYALAKEIGLAEGNVGRLKNGKVTAINFSTLAEICRVLKCQPGDLLAYVPVEQDKQQTVDG